MRIDRIDVNSDTFKVKSFFVKDVEKGILSEITLILNEDVKVTAFMSLATATATNNSDILDSDIIRESGIFQYLIDAVLYE